MVMDYHFAHGSKLTKNQDKAVAVWIEAKNTKDYYREPAL